MNGRWDQFHHCVHSNRPCSRIDVLSQILVHPQGYCNVVRDSNSLIWLWLWSWSVLLIEFEFVSWKWQYRWRNERQLAKGKNVPRSIFLAFRTQREDDAWLRSMTNVKKACLFQHPAGYSLFRMKEKTLKSVRYYILRTTETGKLNQKWTSV